MSHIDVKPTVALMKAARTDLGKPAALHEALVATGIDAFFVLCDGGTASIEGTTYRLREISCECRHLSSCHFDDGMAIPCGVGGCSCDHFAEDAP